MLSLLERKDTILKDTEFAVFDSQLKTQISWLIEFIDQFLNIIDF